MTDPEFEHYQGSVAKKIEGSDDKALSSYQGPGEEVVEPADHDSVTGEDQGAEDEEEEG